MIEAARRGWRCPATAAALLHTPTSRTMTTLFRLPLLFALLTASLPALGRLRPADGTHVYDLSTRSSQDSAWRPVGTMTVEQTTLQSPGDTIVRRVITYDYGAKGRVVDTTLSVARTLAPISERTHKPSGIISFDVARDTVVGVLTSGGAERAIRDALPGPAFNSTDLELVVRSLPLAPGYHERLPIYDPEFGGYRFAEVRVEGRAPGAATAPGAPDAWLVSVSDRSMHASYRVGVTTRALLSANIAVPERGVEYRLLLREQAGESGPGSMPQAH